MTYLCRCSNERCKRRRALARPPCDYVRPPRCAGCGGRKYRVDKWQESSNAALVCRCSGYWFAHRRGSKWCLFADSKLTLSELSEHYGGKPSDYLRHPRYAAPSCSTVEEIPW